MDFQKTPNGRDDFYSGAPQFVKAWTLASDALQGPFASPVREAEPTPAGEPTYLDAYLEGIQDAIDEGITVVQARESIQQLRNRLRRSAPVSAVEPLKALVVEGLALLTSEARIQYRIPYPQPCDKFEEDVKRSDACVTCQWPATDHAMSRILKGISAALEGAATKGQSNG